MQGPRAVAELHAIPTGERGRLHRPSLSFELMWKALHLEWAGRRDSRLRSKLLNSLWKTGRGRKLLGTERFKPSVIFEGTT